VHEAVQTSLLIAGSTLVSVIADKGFDTDSFTAETQLIMRMAQGIFYGWSASLLP
jgi:hypothetical protein